MTVDVERLKRLNAERTRGEWELVRNGANIRIYATGKMVFALHAENQKSALFVVAIANAFPAILERLEQADRAAQALERHLNMVLDTNKWLRDGYRTMAAWSAEEAAERTKQYSLDTLSGRARATLKGEDNAR